MALGCRRHRAALLMTLMVQAADVGPLTFGCVKVSTGSGLFSMVEDGQSINDRCLSWDLGDSLVSGPT